MTWPYLFLGFLTGGSARFLLARSIGGLPVRGFPWGTLAVNLSGCFLIGIFDIWSQKHFRWSVPIRLLFITGFCGAYTTFSSLILEVISFLRDGNISSAALYVFASLAGGVGLFLAGDRLARFF